MTEGERLPLFGEYVLDTVRGCLLHAGRPVHLRPQAYRALKFLTENRGRLVSKDSLIEEVWEGRAVTDDSLVQCLRDVRQALGEGGNQYLRNARGRGYIFDPGIAGNGKTLSISSEQLDVVRVVIEDTGDDDQLAAWSPHHRIKAKPRTMLILSAIAIAAAVAVGLYVKYSTPRAPEVNAIAVLPFSNASGDPNIDYVSDGLTENLIDRLAKLPGVKVIALSSSFTYKDREVDAQEIARALGVQGLVTGTVKQHGNNLIVNAELVDGRDRTRLWGEQYIRKAADIQAVQEEIALTIAKKLGSRLNAQQAQLLTKHATQNPRAYQFYLDGLFHFRKGGFDNVRKALDNFNQAVTLDPSFAIAWVGIANSYRYLVAKSLLDPKEMLVKAKAAAQRALDSDETLPEAHSVMARIKQDEWDWSGAERSYRRAIELNPNLAEAHSRYSQYLSATGQHNEALAEVKFAQELDPLRLSLREPGALGSARRYDEAIDKLQMIIKLNPDFGEAHGALATMYDAKGMHSQAVDEFRTWITLDGETTSILCYLGYALAMSGKRNDARVILEKLKETKEYISPAELAVLYIGLGDKEQALATLEKGYKTRDPGMQNLVVDQYYDSLRRDTRFQDLVKRIGFPA